MAEARAVNPLVEQFRQGRVPRDLRLMAAQAADDYRHRVEQGVVNEAVPCQYV